MHSRKHLPEQLLSEQMNYSCHKNNYETNYDKNVKSVATSQQKLTKYGNFMGTSSQDLRGKYVFQISTLFGLLVQVIIISGHARFQKYNCALFTHPPVLFFPFFGVIFRDFM